MVSKKGNFHSGNSSFLHVIVAISKYSDLEGKVKPILINILNEEKVSAEELSCFLDWLDKVRIGLWLGMIQLDKNYANVDPNYHIETRISNMTAC